VSLLHPVMTQTRLRCRHARLRPVALAAASALGLLGAPLQAAGPAPIPAPATLPTGLNVVHGQAQVATVLKGSAAQMTVRNSAGAILNWDSFSIGAQAGVHFQQADAASKVLNRVTGSDPSAIFGSLTSNGQVWLLNPNGVLFGAGSRVDVAGLVASTLRLDDNSFLDGLRSGRFSFGEGAAGTSVRNEGAIRTAHGGHLVMLSERVENAGTLDAPGGALLLAGAKAATLVDSALPYLAAVVPAGEVLNLGRAAADGGVVDVYAAVVNQQGLVRADTVAVDAQGRIVLKAADTLMLAGGSQTRAVGTAEGHTGGRIDLLGSQVGLVGTATVDVSGTAGGGGIRLGGGLMGLDASVANSRAVFVGPEALLLADTTGAAGKGGSIILWSNEATRAWGRFSARGGSERGDGGFIETSGGWIDARPTSIDVTTRGGAAGTWLIDPNNLTISDTGPDTAITGGPSFTTTGNSAVITTATIAAALNLGNSVTLTTATGGTEAGDIRMIGASLLVAPPSAVSLTLNATRDILLRDSVVTSTGAALSLNLVSAGGGVGAIEIQRSSITTAGGNVMLGGATAAAMPLPDGTFTSTLYSPAIGYDAATASPPTALSLPRHGILVQESTIDAGVGRFSATGLATASGTGLANGVRFLGSGAVQTNITASEIDVAAFGRVSSGYGMLVASTRMQTTAGLSLFGAGPNRGIMIDTADLSLAAAAGSGAVMLIDGFGGTGAAPTSVQHWGVLIQQTGPTPSWGLRVENADLVIRGRSLGDAPGPTTPANGYGVRLLGTGSAGAGVFDFRNATSVSIQGNSLNNLGVYIGSGSLQLPTATAGATEILSTAGSLRLESLSLSGGGNLTLSTAAGSVDPGDTQLVGSTFTFAPAAATALLAQAARDIVVQNSSITSTGSPLNLDFQAAGNNAFGVVSLSGSTITTAGGNLTLGGTVDRQLPLPGGGLTTATFRPARAYSTATGGASSALGGGQDAVRVDSSVITLGAGSFRAVGEGALDARDGVTLSSDTGLMRLTAAQVQIIGHAPAPTAVDGDRVGVIVGGQNTEISATQSLLIQGAGDAGVSVENGARLLLASGAAGTMVVDGYGGARDGVFLASYDLDAAVPPPGRGTRLTVQGGSLSVVGRSTFGSVGLVLDNTAGSPGPLLDLSAATGGSVISAAGSGTNVVAFGVDIVPPAAGTLAFVSPAQLVLDEVFVSGTGGALTFSATSTEIGNSVFSSTAGPLSLAFGGLGSAPVSINNTIIETRGGNVTFGELRTVSSPILGATTVPANWIETDSSDSAAALSISDSVIDAGSGRIVGGGAVRDGGFNAVGLNLSRSVLTASRIELAGRSDYEQGLLLAESTLNATRVLRLAGDSASNFPPTAVGLQIGERSTLQLVDPSAATGSAFELRGRQLTDGIGLLIEGGAVGSGNETRLAIDGAAATLSGTSGSGSGLVLRGSGAGPGGAFINAAAAPSLRLEGLVTLDAATGGTGTGLQLLFARVIGPQVSAASPLDIVANGGGAVGAGLTIGSSSLSSGGVTTVAGNSIAIADSLVSGDGSINLYAADQGASTGSVVIDRAALLVGTTPGSRLYAGTRAGGPAIGVAGIAAGNGIQINDVALSATASDGSIELRGTGAASGGSGVVFARSPMTAPSITMVGRGSFSGDGVFSDDLSAAPSTLRTANLSINGLAANDPAATSLTRAGVVLGRGVALELDFGGTALIEGDLIALGRSAVATGTGLLGFQAFGGPASFVVNATRSMMLREASLDFSDGSGTAVTLRADTDGVDGGRVRINTGTVIRSGGGDITMDGRGSVAASGTSGVPLATVVLEGGIGVFLTGGTLDAGAGVISLTGRTWDFGTGASTEPAVSGVALQSGVNSLTGRRVQIDGSTVSSGFGVTIGIEGGTAAQTINADEIVLTGNGVGTISALGLAAPGVRLLSGAALSAGSSLLLSGVTSSGVEIASATVASGGSLTVDATGPVRIAGTSNITAAGAAVITGVGTPAAAPAVAQPGVTFGAGTLTRGGALSISGTQPAGGQAIHLRADAGSGTLEATAGDLVLSATGSGAREIVDITGDWNLSATGVLSITTQLELALAAGATSGLSPTFSAPSVSIHLQGSGATTLGVGRELDTTLFSAAVAGLPATSQVTLRSLSTSLFGSLAVPGRLRIQADSLSLTSGSVITAGAAGDAIVVGGDSSASTSSFINLAGASALTTPAGRWVILTTSPAATTLGGLTPAFSAYGLGAAPWGVDSAGDLITPIGGNALGYRLGTADVSGAALSVLQTRTYDTTAAITLDPGSWAVSGLVAGDTLALAGSSAATMTDKNVGVAKPVTADAAVVFSVVDASGRPVFGYGEPALAATITPVALTASGTVVANKVYDGNVGLTIASLGSVTPLAGDVVSIDVASVTAAFVDRNVGTAKPVLFSGFALTGADAGNYSVALPTGLTADITPLGLAVTGLAAASRVYDSTTLATLSGSATIAPLGGDTVTLAGTALASFADKNVGSAKPVSVSGYTLVGPDAGNYTLLAPAGLAADITPAALALSGLTAASRVYDATTAATVSGTATLAPALGSDVVLLSGAASGSFADKNVGTAKPVALGGLTLAGADAGNYVITAPGLVADITPASLAVTGLSAASRVYDASTTALLTGSAAVAPLGTDVVTLAGTATGAFADKNVGTAKPVSVSGLRLTGADAGNYTLVAPAGLSADITARALAVTGVAAAGKVYDGTTAATLTGTAVVAPLGADVLTLGGTAVASFADKNAGPAKPVSVSGYTLAGADAANYALVQPVGLSATISAAPLAVTGLSAVSREYDRSTVAPLAGTAAVAPLAGDVLTLAGTAAGAFATAAAATGKPVTVSGLALAGADAANYTLLLPTGLSADVTPRTLTLAGLAAAGRVYDAGTTVAVSGTLAGVLTGDAVGLALSGRLADANVGTAKPVTLSAALSGADAGNYTLAAAGGLSASITPATLRYVALPAFGTSGQALPVLTGGVSGFFGADTLASATTGTLAWTSPATAASPTGLYAISGGGLSALNYLFVQDAANATALTLRAPTVSDPVTTATTVVTTSALFSVSVPLLMSSPTEGRTLDVTPAFAGSVGAEAERRARIAAAPGREGAAGATGAAAAPDALAAAAAAPAVGPTGPTGPTGPSGALGAPAATPAPGGATAPSAAAVAAAALPSVAAVISAASSEAAGGLSFGALDFSRLPRDEIQTLLAARARFKKQIFADGIYRLQQDPTLADVRPCRNEAETDTGQCLITEDLKRQIQAAREAARLRAEAAAAAAAAAAATAAPGTVAPPRPARVQRRVVQAALPVIERKLALLIGVNDYADKAVPQLEGAVRDSRAVRERLEQRLGYETTVLESPSRSEIVRAFNRLALEAQPGDSVIVYYAGHGVVVPVDGVETGFWLPADTDSKKESTWLSNADIGRLIAAIGSRQLMLVSDSCYSGTLVGKERVSVSGDNTDDWLKRRAAVVMSSGGDEPVADEGKEGHSFFAWHFMRALEGLDRWQVGNSLHERLRTAVSREFPQTPQYGGSRGLGHEGNTDFLFERRQIEAAAKAP
jgi:filamentous hemagglutinin family protein